jgi:hypothetical protein
MANKDRGSAKVKKVASRSLKEKRALKKAKHAKPTTTSAIPHA